MITQVHTNAARKWFAAGAPCDIVLTMTYSQIDLQDGTGAMATTGQTATVHYTGWLYSESEPENKGTQFDSSVGRGPFSFKLGSGQVIRGWDQGVQGMKVGGHRRLVLPPEFAYGAGGAGRVIPPNATLVFDVELLGVA
ncbi:MAG: FKBP-type peptidyl-prolyl cis-trans isomerase [Acidobacteria bacterium]|nr:FKBP-type peptidyl-prolyl cis-trans isomerase [Acidobacteriota bacterium]